MKTVRAILVTAFLFQMGFSMAQNSGYPTWKSLEPGTYSVGFKTIDYWDKSRTIGAKYDAQENENNQRFLPIQISIWYPSKDEWTETKAIPFKHYFDKTVQKNDFQPLDSVSKEQSMEIFFNYAKHGLSIELSPDDLNELGTAATAAMLNAQEAPGGFPVILAGHDGGVWKMSTLCEYLASHGFVVISTGGVSSTLSSYGQKPQVGFHKMEESRK